MEAYQSETIFHLPGAFEHFPIYQFLLALWENEPHLFKTNIKIGSVYGAPGGIWNGGRVLPRQYFVREDLEQIKQTYERYKIPIRFTFTNCLIEEKHLMDTYCNMLLEMFNTGNNEIICNSDILEQYIRVNYQDNYKYISSTTKCFKDKELQTQELEKNYYLVVLDYNHNNDFEFLKSLPLNIRPKVEMLCNSSCSPNCPFRADHYRQVSISQLDFSLFQKNGGCIGGFETYFKAKKLSTYISPTDINTKYLPLGINNFKLEGRIAKPINLIEILVDYLIKTQYQLEVRQRIQELLY